MEGEDQTMRLVLVIVEGEMQEELPLRTLSGGEVDLVALAGSTLLEFRVEGLATAGA